MRKRPKGATDIDEKTKTAMRVLGEPPSLWAKCPKCKDIIYAKEFEKTNKCPKCEYVFPYPFAKVRKLERLIGSKKATWEDVSKLVLNVLDAIPDRKERAAFLRESFRLVLEEYDWRGVQKRIARFTSEKSISKGVSFRPFPLDGTFPVEEERIGA